MKVTNSYKVKLVNVNSSLDETINVYRNAITYIIKIVNNEWLNIESLKAKERKTYVEKLIHKTKENPNPIYADFDKLFYKLPSYLRRSAIQDAIGIVSSYKSNLANYEAERYEAISNGIRYRRVNARNTSKLAYDGSGKVIRDKKNAKLCTFATGKQYNCDLNASYNIGARYFIKEAQENLSEKKWSQAVAKVPELGRRTQCTLSTLISLHQVM